MWVSSGVHGNKYRKWNSNADEEDENEQVATIVRFEGQHNASMEMNLNDMSYTDLNDISDLDIKNILFRRGFDM